MLLPFNGLLRPEKQKIDNKRPQQKHLPTPKLLSPLTATVPQTAQVRAIMASNGRSILERIYQREGVQFYHLPP